MISYDKTPEKTSTHTRSKETRSSQEAVMGAWARVSACARVSRERGRSCLCRGLRRVNAGWAGCRPRARLGPGAAVCVRPSASLWDRLWGLALLAVLLGSTFFPRPLGSGPDMMGPEFSGTPFARFPPLTQSLKMSGGQRCQPFLGRQLRRRLHVRGNRIQI